MAIDAHKVGTMLRAVRSQLRTDLRQMAEDVLQRRLIAGPEAVHAAKESRDANVEHVKVELALRMMAYRCRLLTRIDEALDPSRGTPSASSW